MSLLPYLFDRIGFVRPRRLVDQQFGLALTPDDLLALVATPNYIHNREYYRPWRHLSNTMKDLGSSIKADSKKFQINLDLQHFGPEEISVKTVNGYIVVEAKHEERKDEHSFVSRQLTRRYPLPEGILPETVESKLSTDGVLTISAPRKIPESLKGERTVPITQTGPVRRQIKDQNEGTSDQKEEK